MKKKLYKFFTAFVMNLAIWNFAWSQPIELVTPLVPGGAVDLTARAISKALTEANIENIVTYRPGGNGDIAMQYVLQKTNNVVLVASSATFVFSSVSANRDNLYAKQMTLFGPTLTNAMVFLTSNKKTTFTDLVARAKKESVPCGVSNAHGEIELRRINQKYNINFEPILYKGTGQLIPDLIGGHISCGYDQIAPYTALTDRLEFLATSEDWSKSIPAVSTVLPGYKYHTWYASAIPNDSNLLKNSEFLKILTNWAHNKEISQPLIDRSFQLIKSNPNLNFQAQQETETYLQLLKK